MPRPPETADRPAATLREPPAPEPTTTAPDLVLIAADEPDLRVYVRRCLDGLAAEVVEAADGLEARSGSPAGRRTW